MLRCTGETSLSFLEDMVSLQITWLGLWLWGCLCSMVWAGPAYSSWALALCIWTSCVALSAAVRKVFDSPSVGESGVLQSPTIKGLKLIFNSVANILWNWIQRPVHISLGLYYLLFLPFIEKRFFFTCISWLWFPLPLLLLVCPHLHSQPDLSLFLENKKTSNG